jgi:hypothetical protein
LYKNVLLILKWLKVGYIFAIGRNAVETSFGSFKKINNRYLPYLVPVAGKESDDATHNKKKSDPAKHSYKYPILLFESK